MKIAPKNIVNCYSIAGISRLAGIEDYTEGAYNGNPDTPYKVAQRNQHNYLLDEVGANHGFRLLDVGCGLGTLLLTAKKRGVQCTGITISEDQVALCRQKGLNVQLFNYKDLPSSWKGTFDGIVANGSLEHFCDPKEALRGKQNEVYRKMFEIFAGLIDPSSSHGKVATTAIHFSGNHVDPRRFLRNPFLQPLHNEGRHFSILHRGYGGYYPVANQLQNCATQHFSLKKEADATEDYRLTSEYWTKQFKNTLWTNPLFRKKLMEFLFRQPVHTIWAFLSFVGFEAWPWQFRGPNPPTRLYRHTWKIRR